MKKKSLFFSHFRAKVPSPKEKGTIATPHFAPLGQRISEQNEEKKLVFLQFIC